VVESGVSGRDPELGGSSVPEGHDDGTIEVKRLI
jgi:hypothetical protein